MNDRAPLANPEAALRLVRVLKIAFILSSILFLFVVIEIPSKSPQPVDRTVELALLIAALTTIVLGYAFPKFLASSGQGRSGSAPQASALQAWFSRCVMSFAFLEACSLFGVVLHFLGAELLHSELLIGVAILALAFWSPETPPSSEDEGNAGA